MSNSRLFTWVAMIYIWLSSDLTRIEYPDQSVWFYFWQGVKDCFLVGVMYAALEFLFPEKDKK